MGNLGILNRDFIRIVELTPELRRRIEDTVEQLIAILDAYDGGDAATGPSIEDAGDDRECDAGDEREGFDDLEEDFVHHPTDLPRMPRPGL